MTPKSQFNRTIDPEDQIDVDLDLDTRKAQLAAARAHLEDGVQEAADESRTLLWSMAIPFACGALVSGVALWLFKSRKPRTFALVQFVTQAPPKLPASPGLTAALGAGARVVLPQLLDLLSQKTGTEEDAPEGPPVAH